jgi:hypothetical protein
MIVALVSFAGGIALAPAAQASELERACSALDQSGGADCELERSRDWSLTTSLLVGGGDKARVAAVEQRFCDEALAHGARARVVRWNRMPGLASPAAKLECSCGAGAVSTGPPARR